MWNVFETHLHGWDLELGLKLVSKRDIQETDQARDSILHTARLLLLNLEAGVWAVSMRRNYNLARCQRAQLGWDIPGHPSCHQSIFLPAVSSQLSPWHRPVEGSAAFLVSGFFSFSSPHTEQFLTPPPWTNKPVYFQLLPPSVFKISKYSNLRMFKKWDKIKPQNEV